MFSSFILCILASFSCYILYVLYFCVAFGEINDDKHGFCTKELFDFNVTWSHVFETQCRYPGKIPREEVILNLISAKCIPACCMRLRHCHSIFRNLNHSGFLLSAFCSKCLKLGLLISLASAKNSLISLMFQN